MDDAQKRRILIITVVAAVALGGYSLIAPPKTPPPASQRAQTAAGAGRDRQPGQPTARGLTPEERRTRLEAQRLARIETPEFVATFTNLSAALLHFELKGPQFLVAGRRIDLVSTDREEYLPLRVDLGGVPIPQDAVWQIEQLSPTALRFTWSGEGFRVERKVEAGHGPYQIWSTVRVTNTSAGTRPVRVNHHTYHYVKRDDEGGGLFASRSPAISSGLCLAGDKVHRADRKDLAAGQTYRPPTFTGWDNAYFASLLAPHGAPADFCTMKASDRGVGSGGDPHGTLFEIRLAHARTDLAPGASATVRALAYVGPKETSALALAGHGMPAAVDLGFFAIIARGMVKLLSFIHGFVPNWGLAIILMTVLVKLVLFPLTLSQLRGMAKMRMLKPELDKLQKLYEGDREKIGAATLELYRRHGVNPVSGCLPTLAQLPVWWALYTSLSTNIALFHAPFAGWLQDLSARDPYFIMPVLLGALMFVQQRMTPAAMDPAQAKMMQWLMPIMITVFMLFLPAGLTLYMFTNSALSIAQQRFIEYRLQKATAAAASPDGAEALATAGAAGGAATQDDPPKGGSGKPGGRGRPGKSTARRSARG
jgi:YidC/Oxa1 family membrane protein insertase